MFIVHTSLQVQHKQSDQGSTITFCIHWPGGPVDFKSYWPPKKVTGPNFFVVGIHIYTDKNRYIVQ